jgi:hypothetical protein
MIAWWDHSRKPISSSPPGIFGGEPDEANSECIQMIHVRLCCVVRDPLFEGLNSQAGVYGGEGGGRQQHLSAKLLCWDDRVRRQSNGEVGGHGGGGRGGAGRGIDRSTGGRGGGEGEGEGTVLDEQGDAGHVGECARVGRVSESDAEMNMRNGEANNLVAGEIAREGRRKVSIPFINRCMRP